MENISCRQRKPYTVCAVSPPLHCDYRDELDTVLEEQFLIGPMAMDDSSPPFMLDSLNLETASDDSNPDFTALEEPPSDLLDLMDGEHGWSPVKRPKLFPQKLY